MQSEPWYKALLGLTPEPVNGRDSGYAAGGEIRGVAGESVVS